MKLLKYKDKKNIVLAVLIAVSLLLFWLFGTSNGKDLVFNFSAKHSAKKGWDWLSNYRVDFNKPITPAIIKIVNDKYCNVPLMEILIQNRWEKFSTHPYYPIYERFFSDWEDYKVTFNVKDAIDVPQEGYNMAFSGALYCDQIPTNEEFENTAFLNLAEETGYDLSRKFWAAAIFKKNGCFTKNYNIDELLNVAATKMAEAQELSEGVDDLYVERTAFLLNYGFRDMVKKEWIKKIIDAQDKTGAWINPNFFDKDFKDPQTSMMAVWVLSEYTNSCPFGSYE